MQRDQPIISCDQSRRLSFWMKDGISSWCCHDRLWSFLDGQVNVLSSVQPPPPKSTSSNKAYDALLWIFLYGLDGSTWQWWNVLVGSHVFLMSSNWEDKIESPSSLAILVSLPECSFSSIGLPSQTHCMMESLHTCCTWSYMEHIWSIHRI